MTNDDTVVRRLAHARPGMRLVAHRAVAMPMFRLTLDAVVEQKKTVDPIEEYLLKSVDCGFEDLEGVADFLGLEFRIVEAAASELYHRDDIEVREGRVRVTGTGRATLQDLVTSLPSREEISVDFDRMLFSVEGLPSRFRMKPFDLQRENLEELPPPRGRSGRPQVEDLDFETISRLVQRLRRSSEIAPVLLAVREVLRAERVYERGLLLVYESPDLSEHHLAIAVDGRLSDAHEQALGLAGGAGRLGLNYKQLAMERVDFLELAPANIVQQVAPEATVIPLEARLAELDSSGQTPGGSNQAIAAKEVRDKLNAFPVRRLRVWEHHPLLLDSLANASRRLLLISPWMSTDIVDAVFLRRVEKLCRRQVRVHIGFGIGGLGRKSKAKEREARESIDRLARKFENLTFGDLGNTHAKILICDDVWVTTSFNWMSFKGDPDRTFRQEEGLLVSIPEEVERAYVDFSGQVNVAATGSP